MTKVLLIDDDPELLEVLGEWLTSRGHQVRTLLDVRGVERVMDEFTPDLVVLDGMLQGTTGQAIAGDLERDGRLRVVYLSGLPRYELPADRLVLQKPIDLELLERIVREAPSNLATLEGS